jgi:hypothetical protein
MAGFECPPTPCVIRELTDHERAIGLQARVGAQKTDFVRLTKGNIEASERVELSSQSRLAGEIRAPKVTKTTPTSRTLESQPPTPLLVLSCDSFLA